jgi:uncharacterized membrane protein YidH (DUF202 family)
VEIKKSSRHYRRFERWRALSNSKRARSYRGYYDYKIHDYRNPAPVSLCPYFWIVTLRAPVRLSAQRAGELLTYWEWLPYALGFIAVNAALVALGVYAPGVVGATAWWHPVVYAYAVFLAAVTILSTVYATFAYIDNRHERKRYSDETTLRQAIAQSVPGQYIKAKKRKVCPFLEFK